MKKALFYISSFTWGIIMSIIGCLTTLVLLICGKKPKMFGYCWYFQFANDWCGVNFGPCFIVDNQSDNFVKAHEHGHGIQNALLGPLFPFIIAIPSAVRCLYRTIYFAGYCSIFEAILVPTVAIITFSFATAAMQFTKDWITIVLYVLIYACFITLWIVYGEGIKYDETHCPLYNDIWFENWASNLGEKFMCI